MKFLHGISPSLVVIFLTSVSTATAFLLPFPAAVPTGLLLLAHIGSGIFHFGYLMTGANFGAI